MAGTQFEDANRDFRAWYAEHFATLRVAEKTFRNLIQLLLSDSDEYPAPKVISRLKDRDECVKKFQRKYQSQLEDGDDEYHIKDYVTDLIGIRVICLYESDLNPVVDRLRDQLDVLEVTDKTSELEVHKDRFGYKGMHLDARLGKRRRKLPEYNKLEDYQFEVQVRTIVQDAWSEIDHKLKYKKDLPGALQRRVYNLAGLFELADREFDAIRRETKQLLALCGGAGDEATVSDEPLTPFNLYRIFRSYFPKYPFEEDKVEGFLDDIRAEKPDVTIGEFRDAMENHLDRVREYRQWSLMHLGRNLNPYTEIRHVLYRYKSGVFENLLFSKSRDSFCRWDSTGSTFKSS